MKGYGGEWEVVSVLLQRSQLSRRMLLIGQRTYGDPLILVLSNSSMQHV